MKWSSFRGWVHNLWVQNCDEHSQYNIPAWGSAQLGDPNRGKHRPL